ncbi:hypothetical protein J4402_00525 [Candidatus Pacearchaeota archaeon]|nr:hypothetical protein [Candidatus Pacearchaeota archaeon]
MKRKWSKIKTRTKKINSNTLKKLKFFPEYEITPAITEIITKYTTK